MTFIILFKINFYIKFMFENKRGWKVIIENNKYFRNKRK